MAVDYVQALILMTSRLDQTLAFYQALGLPLDVDDHGDDDDGPVHYACEIGPCHFAIFPANDGDAPHRRTGGATMLGFRVDDLDATLLAVQRTGARVIWEPHLAPWGRRAVVSDPDGRSVEINEPLPV